VKILVLQFKSCSYMLVHKCVWILSYISPLFLSFFLQFLFLFSISLNIIFTLVSVVFLNPFMDFDNVFKLLEYAGTCMCVQDGGTR